MPPTLDEARRLPPFQLLGGPLHRLGCQLGLVRQGTNTVRLGLVIGVPMWAVLLVLGLIDGHDPLSFQAISPHARLLLAIPLLFVCESVLAPRLTEVVRVLTRSGVVPDTALPALGAVVDRVTRWKDAWQPEALCLLCALGLSWLAPRLQIPGTASYGLDRGAVGMSMTHAWYSVVCLTVMRFLLLRWVWRLGLWTYCLWRLSRLPLQLLPGHPDGVAGLGNLEVAHTHFAPLVLAISVSVASSFAADIGSGKLALEAVYPAIGLILLVDAVLFVGPLLFFMPELLACRVKGMSLYMEFAERYVKDFESKWLGTPAGATESPLGSADIQSLADLGNSVERVSGMRLAPVTQRLLLPLAAAALLPMLPLAFFEYPLIELARQFVTRLTGL